MTDFKGRTVTGADGAEGRVVAVEPSAEGAPPLATIERAGGGHLQVPQESLTQHPDGSLRLPVNLATNAADDSTGGGIGHGETRIPVVEERPVVHKEAVERRYRVTTRVREEEETVDEPLRREEVEVRHVPIGSWVETPPPIRQEGATTVIPVVEEVLFVEKRLRLREEVHVTKHRVEVRDPKAVTLRREEVAVEPVETVPPSPRVPSS